ncbi:MAG: hypothetical protein HY862_05505 [Chloroflexi bacterium]|nr:hypothetical protein [Chloroflexota bacterium]
MQEGTADLSKPVILTEHHAENEGQWFTSFVDVVRESQKVWHSLKKPPIREVSQSVDIPHFVREHITSIALDNVPSYVPENLVSQLRKTHPEPVIGIGMVIDRRTISENEIAELIYSVPERVLSEQESWEKGIRLLNEIATDTLANDILKQIYKRDDPQKRDSREALQSFAIKQRTLRIGERWFKRLAGVVARLSSRPTYAKGIRLAQEAMGGVGAYEAFRQKLVVAMLSGERAEIDEFLKSKGYTDLDTYACDIGKQSYYGDTPMANALRPLSKSLAGGIPYYNANGVSLRSFPGVIQLSMLNVTDKVVTAASGLGIYSLANGMTHPVAAVVGLGTAAIGFAAAIPSTLHMPHTVLHETCHYLSNNLTHLGLFPIQGYRKR